MWWKEGLYWRIVTREQDWEITDLNEVLYTVSSHLL